jgi:hypothetical protein
MWIECMELGVLKFRPHSEVLRGRHLITVVSEVWS